MIKKIERIIRHSVIITKHNNKKSKPLLNNMLDLLKWTYINRGYVTHYFLLGLNQEDKKLSDYLNFRSFKNYYKDFYPPSYLCLLEDKLVFEKFINNFPEYAPKNIGYVTRYHFYLPDGLPQPLENIRKYPMKCIVKNTWGFGGKDIFLLTIEAEKIFINGKESSMDDLVNNLPERSVLQEILEQHKVLKQLHPESINTVRVVTVNTGTKVEIVSTFLRVGNGGNFVDNIAKGNIFVPLDKETGNLSKVGVSPKEAQYYISHPQTKVVFEGIQVPYFQEAKELCKKLHYQLPYFFILGWDIAFTPTGPVVIESNNIHKIVEEQLHEGGLKKQFDVYIKEFKENKRKERRLNYA